MRTVLFLVLAASGSVGLYLNANEYGNWPVREQESVQKTFTTDGSSTRIVVDNVDGYVHVSGVSGSQVRMTAHKVIRAENDNDFQEAKKEIRLTTEEKPGSVSIYYDAPWRCRDHEGPCGDHHRKFYQVTYNIDIEAPRDARVVVSTVNNGDIQIRGTAGPFDVHNVNGGISMSGIGGSGDVSTVNGPVSVRFDRNPQQACGFKSVNGAVDIWFQNGLSADLLLKTFNGQVYTDFEVSSRAAATAEPERRNGKFVYRSNRLTAARIGQGGPEHKFETLNFKCIA
jgi:hypothetical protein